MAELNPPLWELGHIGWFQEYWIARNVQRQRGERCDPLAPKLPSIEPDADRWYDSSNVPHDTRWQLDAARARRDQAVPASTRLNTTLELLDSARRTGCQRRRAVLLPARAVPRRHARRGLRLHGADARFRRRGDGRSAADHDAARGARSAAVSGHALAAGLERPGRAREQIDVGPRDAGGFVFDNEKWAHEVAVPEFEIDAQPVSWAQYAEFVEDGGYDEPRWWQPAGWQWLQRSRAGARRAMSTRCARACCSAASASSCACRWRSRPARELARGRRLVPLGRAAPADRSGMGGGRGTGRDARFPLGRSVGMDGDAVSARIPASAPVRIATIRSRGSARTSRCAARRSRPAARMRHPKYRNFYLPERDDIFVGFRSCAA